MSRPDAAAAYPYPGDDPASIGSVSETLGICSNELTYLNQSLTKVQSGLSSAWVADAATKCNADIATLIKFLPTGASKLAAAGKAATTYQTTLVSVRREVDGLRTQWTTLQNKLSADATNYTHETEFNDTKGAAATIQDEQRLQSTVSELDLEYYAQVTKSNTAAETCGAALRAASGEWTDSPTGEHQTQSLDDVLGLGKLGVLHDIEMHDLAVKYADDLKNNHKLDSNWGKQAHQVALAMAKYGNDPAFAAAFFAELGPQMSQTLPTFLSESGDPDAYADIQAYSKAFGVAVTNASMDPGMKPVMDAYTSAGGSDGSAWDRGVMTHFGTFPPAWIAQAADASALNGIAGRQEGKDVPGWYEDMRNRMGGPEIPGIENNVAALWLSNVQGSPEASRLAIENMGWDGEHNAVSTNIKSIIDYAGQADSRDLSNVSAYNQAYGKVFEAASGADNEIDGQHSAAASTFAAGVFDAFGKEDHPYTTGAEASLAKLGGSYVQEMAAGVPVGDNASDTKLLSGEEVVPVPGDNGYPGQNPAFAIPKELQSKFMATFVGDPNATTTFDNAAGSQYHDALVAAARADGVAEPGQNETMNHVAKAYGTVAGIENHTTTEVVGEADEAAKEANENLKSILSLGLDAIPGEKIAEGVPGIVWDMSKHLGNMGLESTFGETDDPRFDALGEKSHEIALAQPYETLSILHEAGYPGTDQVPPSLLDPTTHELLPMGKVLDDPQKVTALQDYLNYTKNHPPANHTSVYDKSSDVAGNYSGGYDGGNG